MVLKLGVAALAVTMSLYAIETLDEYKTAMRAGGAASGMINKNLGGDLSVVAKSAGDLKAAFEQIKEYWAAKNAADAVEASDKIIAAADQVQAAATAGNVEEARAAAKIINATCGGCHMAHRGRGPDGFTIK